MVMTEICQRAFDHRVLKVHREIPGSDSDPHLHPHAKMPGPPFHFFAQTYQATGSSAYCLFSGGGGGVKMKIDAPGKIKTSLHGSVNMGLQAEFRTSPITA